VSWTRILEQPAAWYGSGDAVAIADTVLLFQRRSGGWPKNTDMARRLEFFEVKQVEAAKADADSTIDNGATTTEMRFLARVYAAARADRFRDAFMSALDYLFAAQYPNGGWPQFYPLRTDYSRHITFNDNAVTNVLNLLRDVAGERSPMAFVDEARRARAKAAYEKGVSVILASQIRVNGRLTAWCAQVDALTLEPRQARTYEHPSISGSESVGIVRFLMAIERPSAAVITAVESAVAWFRDAQLTGMRVVDRPDAGVPGGVDRVVVQDPAASPIWARFYEIGTGRPIFSGRDGVVRYSLAEIELERRVNYSWLGPYAADLLAKDYPTWKARVGSEGGRD
jgi:PelA/Pel-15E family pectate lyase